ncbi:MAG: S8 family serine peptidase [Candidatus Nomurabacteria bacterium]|nr:MAG: S8 family serine peptidase [Candidatus Nomurabacteria bacterium]
MRWGRFIGGIVLVWIFSFFSPQVEAQSQFVYPGQRVVGFTTTGISANEEGDIITDNDHLATILSTFPSLTVQQLSAQSFLFSLPNETEANDLQDRLASLPETRYIEPNYLVGATFTPNDPLYNQQWNFTKVKASQAWDYDTSSPTHGGDPSVIVAVLDTGVAYQAYTDPNPAKCLVENPGNCLSAGAEYAKAPDFSATNFTTGYDFVNEDTHPNDDNGHGTHVSSTIAETTHNSLGAAGLAYHSTIMPVKVLARDGYGTTADIAQGIDYARTHGADIISMSLGTSSYSQALTDAVNDAIAQGILVVAATGNANSSTLLYPARTSGVIAVGATGNTTQNTRASYSNYGQNIALVAPGGDGSSSIIQQGFTNLDGDSLPADFTTFGYVGYQGTSMATPHVSAALALFLAAGADPADAKGVLTETAKDLGSSGYDLEYGYGLLDIDAGLSVITTDVTPPVSSASLSPSSPNGQNGFYSTAPQMTLSASDDAAGVSAIFYRINSGSWQTYSSAVTLPKGNITVEYYAEDLADNIESAHSFEVKIDTLAPTVTITYPFAGSSTGNRRHYIVGVSRDDDSGIAEVTVNGRLAFRDGNTYSGVLTLGPGLNTVTVKATDQAGLVSTATDTMNYDVWVNLLSAPLSNHSPTVRTLRQDGSLLWETMAYAPNFTGGVNITSGDIDRDGLMEFVSAPASSGGPHIRVFSSRGALEYQFMAYAPSYRGGVSIATCDLDGDGRDEIIVGTGAGKAPQVRIFSGGGLYGQFYAYPSYFRIGLSVACGDVTGDAIPEIVVAPISNGGPHVRVFNGSGGLVSQFFAYPSYFRIGLDLAVGDVDGNGVSEIVVAPLSNGGPHVRVFNASGEVQSQFFAFAENFRGGVRIASADVNADGADDIIVGAGIGGGPHLRVFDGNGSVIEQMFTFDPAFRGGISVGANFEPR